MTVQLNELTNELLCGLDEGAYLLSKLILEVDERPRTWLHCTRGRGLLQLHMRVCVYECMGEGLNYAKNLSSEVL